VLIGVEIEAGFAKGSALTSAALVPSFGVETGAIRFFKNLIFPGEKGGGSVFRPVPK